MKNRLNIGTQVALVAFVVLATYTFWYTTETANNLLQADDWRFLLIFYKKWLDGTFQFRDLFSDKHPIALHPIIYIANAEFFSLHRQYVAWLGLIIKTLTGALLLSKLFRNEAAISSNWLAVLFPLYIVLLFYGMNDVSEYIWPLVTYQSSMTFFCGLVTLMVLDTLLVNGNIKGMKAIALAFVAIFSLLLMGTPIKLFFLAILLAFFMIAIAERKVTATVALPALVIFLALVFHSLFLASLDLPKGGGFAITLNSMVGLTTNWLENLRLVAFGLAAGIATKRVLHYPSAALDIFAVSCLVVVGYSFFVFYKERMWKITIIPVVLIIYMLLTFLGAIVFRGMEIVPGAWPLYIPRYFPTYHMGWIGVVWIYYYKFRIASKRGLVLAIAVPLSFGICLMLLGLAQAWVSKPYIESANRKAEVAVCKYANDELTSAADVPMWVRGHSFSREAVLLLKERKLNIFSSETRYYRCVD